MSEGQKVFGGAIDLDDFQHAFMTRYNELAEVLDKKASTCQEIIRFLEPFVENERTYAQNIDKIVQQRMPVQLVGEEPGLFNVWGIFKQWGSTLKSNAAESYKEFKAAKEELEKCYATFDQERKKFSAFLNAKQKEFGANARKLTKARDKYFKRCQSELSQPSPDTKQMTIDKENYKALLVVANNALKIFYSFDLPKHLEVAEASLLARIESVQNCIRRIVTVNKVSCETLGTCNLNVLGALNATEDPKRDISELTKKYNLEHSKFELIPQFTYQEYSSSSFSNAPQIHESNASDDLVLGRPQTRSDPNILKILFDADTPSAATKKGMSSSSPQQQQQQQQPSHPLSLRTTWAFSGGKDQQNKANDSPVIQKPANEFLTIKAEVVEKAAANSCKVLGVSLDEIMERQKGSDEKLPLVVKYFVESLLKMKVSTVPNIFKRGGKALAVKELKENIDKGVFNEITDPYVCGDVFKFWIRSLPEPLIPNSLYEEAIKCCTDTESGEIYKKLPEPNKSVVEYLSHFLHYMSTHSATTKMNDNALANMFSSCIMKCPYVDIKEMISASEKQSYFLLGLMDAASSCLIPNDLFQKSVKLCLSESPEKSDEEKNKVENEADKEGRKSDDQSESKSAAEGYYPGTPMSTPPPPLRRVNINDNNGDTNNNSNNGNNDGNSMGTPLGGRWIPPQPKKPPPLPPDFGK